MAAFLFTSFAFRPQPLSRLRPIALPSGDPLRIICCASLSNPHESSLFSFSPPLSFPSLTLHQFSFSLIMALFLELSMRLAPALFLTALAFLSPSLSAQNVSPSAPSSSPASSSAPASASASPLTPEQRAGALSRFDLLGARLGVPVTQALDALYLERPSWRPFLTGADSECAAGGASAALIRLTLPARLELRCSGSPALLSEARLDSALDPSATLASALSSLAARYGAPIETSETPVGGFFLRWIDPACPAPGSCAELSATLSPALGRQPALISLRLFWPPQSAPSSSGSRPKLPF